MVKNTSKVGVGIALAAFILNLMLPGLGSLIAKRTKEGTWQIVLFVIGVILTLILVGFLISLVVWIWALVTSIQILKEADSN